MPQEKEIKDSKNPESNNRSIVSVLYSRIYKLKIERAEKEEINNENEEFNFLIHFLEGIKDLLLRDNQSHLWAHRSFELIVERWFILSSLILWA